MKHDLKMWPLHLSDEDIENAKRMFLEREQIMKRLEQMDSAYLKSLIPPTVPAVPLLRGGV